MHNTEDSWSHSMKQKRDWTSHTNGIYINVYQKTIHTRSQEWFSEWWQVFLLIISLKNVNKKQWRKKKAEFSVNTIRMFRNIGMQKIISSSKQTKTNNKTTTKSWPSNLFNAVSEENLYSDQMLLACKLDTIHNIANTL